MARRSSRRGFVRKSEGREANVFARRSLPLPFDELDSLYAPLDVQDRRRFHPEGAFRSPVDIYGKRVRIVANMRSPVYVRSSRVLPVIPRVPHGLGFRLPMEVLICGRRRARREVLHAKDIAGSTGITKRRETEYSRVRC